ncbi:KAP family NTPase [Citrobacter sp. Cf093]|uniref:P-loop NTPase fold protein n=1 Tax=unclassified Citrobacter TaxID=2644389 RepID=UPI0025775E75|nr:MULTISPECIES: P-loop NTPase fold protein [unclassified Citrobacter]MDM3157127.1 KAP family NTPase [Citrobacter sp. Cf122]MDM3213041.1 KAP family NTPase [Citrobacter sp. Cf093]
MDLNNHIIDNLNYYLNTSTPEYAFMITGGWGAGKTYFIENFIKEYNKNAIDSQSGNKIIKISLFGFKTTSSIDEMIFQSLHPLLGHRYTKLAGNILKGALKLGCKIDINGDSKPDVDINTSLDKIKFREIFSTNTDSGEIIIALDDLERTDIPLKEILGYVNYLVEISKVKVILIANEKILHEKDKSSEDKNTDIYSKFKEKVIGKTFQIKHNIDNVLDGFLDESECAPLKRHRDVIKNIYIRSDDTNLRKLKQSILDFGYIANYIDEEKFKNEEYSSLLIRVFFALSLEMKSGELSEEKLRNNEPFQSEKDNSDGSNNAFYKYDISYRNLYVGDLWADILFKGDASNLKSATDELVYFKQQKNNEHPLWFKLWNFSTLNEEQFISLTNQLVLEFDSLQKEEHQVYLHKLALIIYFSKNSLISKEIDEINNTVYEYIKTYKDGWAILNNRSFEDIVFGNNTGYSYYNDSDEDFRKLFNLLRSECKSISDELKHQAEIIRANEIFTYLSQGNKDELINILYTENQFKPFFNKLNAEDLVKVLLHSSNYITSYFNHIIKERYTSRDTLNGLRAYKYLKIEEEFWIELQNKISKEIPRMPPLKKHFMEQLDTTIKEIITILSSVPDV